MTFALYKVDTSTTPSTLTLLTTPPAGFSFDSKTGILSGNIDGQTHIFEIKATTTDGNTAFSKSFTISPLVPPVATGDSFSTDDTNNFAQLGSVLGNDTHVDNATVTNVSLPTVTLPSEYTGLGALQVTAMTAASLADAQAKLTSYGIMVSIVAGYDISPTGALDKNFILTGNPGELAHLVVLADGNAYLVKDDAFDFLPLNKTLTLNFNYNIQDAGGTSAPANVTITITGTDNNDVLVGTSDKSLSGGAGDNVLYLLDGKGGGTFYTTSPTLNNFVDLQYAGSPTAGITVNLGAPVATASGPSIGTVTLQNIQNVIGSSGDDLFIAGTGPESFDGGAGSNTIDYSYSTTGVVVNLSSSVIGKTNQTITFTSGFILSGAVSSDTALIGNGGPVDTLKNIQNVTGSSHDDVIYAGDGNTTIEGGAGNDYIKSGSGQDTFVYNMTQIGGLGNDIIMTFHSGDILKFTHIASADLPKYTDVIDFQVLPKIEMYSDPTLHDSAHLIGTITLFGMPYVVGKTAISDYPIIQTSTTSVTPNAFNDAFSTTDTPNVAATLIGNVLANDTHNVEDVVSSVVTPTITLPAEYSGLGSLGITPVSSTTDVLGNSELSALAASLGVETSQIAQAYDITPTGVLDNGFILTGTHESPAKLAILKDGSVYLIKNGAFDFLPAGENVTFSFNYTLQDPISTPAQTSTANATITVTGTDNNDVLVGTSDKSLSGGAGDNVLYLLDGKGGGTFDSTSQTLNNFLDLQYAGSPTAGITVNLGAPVATASGPSIGTVTLKNIQNVIGSSGDDLFIAGTGPESFDAGAGSNTIDYSYSTTGVVVNLSSSVVGVANQTIKFTSGFILSGAVSSDTALIGNGGPVDTLKNIQNVTGSPYSDVIFAGDGNTTIEGGAGSDIIEGGSGQDNTSYAVCSKRVGI
ncbi:Putative RTX family hemolysin [Candidatus Bealeia paramacronuclearis]|uniref:RTX family hemolysin n=1 Tax=Candidatus Bealeia paramacronuclearis TaxID=1921001 RepID=A0ABZ2C7Z4_9PROT